MVLLLKISLTFLLVLQLLPSSIGFPSGCGCGCCGCGCGCGCGSPPQRPQNGGCTPSGSGDISGHSIGHTTFRPPIYPHAVAEYCDDDKAAGGQAIQTNSAIGGGGAEGSEAHQRSGVKGYLKGKQAKGSRPTLPPAIANHPSSLSPPQLETFTKPSRKAGAPDYSG